MHVHVVGDVVSIVLEWRRIEGQQPHRGNAEILEVIQFLCQSREIPNAVIITVVERTNMEFVNDRVFVPQRIVLKRKAFELGHKSY